MGLFKLLKKLNKDEYDLESSEDFDNFVYEDLDDSEDEELQDMKLPRKLEDVDISEFSKEDVNTYIQSQCDIMEESSRNIDIAKEEYAAVTSYFSDIQLIETAPDDLHDEIIRTAENVAGLTVDRRIFKAEESKLSNNTYARMERIESEMPKALIDLQNDESYFEVVKKDMRMLEGERASLRYDAKDLAKRQIKIKKVSTNTIIGLCIVFLIFIIASLAMKEETNVLFLAVTFLAAFFAVGLFALLKTTERKVILTEIKLNKATNLLNKVKIKYINSANILDYEYSKYNVKSSYEFSRQYELYLEMKAEKQKVSKVTSELNDEEIKLEGLLKQLRLYDTHIWLAQVKALADNKEMVEVRHGLNQRRQKLRNQIEYNQNRIEESKNNVRRVTDTYPEYRQQVLDIVEHYENRNRN